MEVNNDLTEKGQRDKRLIEQALAGSQAAYGELMSNYEDSIYFLVLKMVRDKEEAEDLKIEIFGKAFLKLEQYTTQFAFSTWLFRIASNHCIDFIRKKRMKTLAISVVTNYAAGLAKTKLSQEIDGFVLVSKLPGILKIFDKNLVDSGTPMRIVLIIITVVIIYFIYTLKLQNEFSRTPLPF